MTPFIQYIYSTYVRVCLLHMYCVIVLLTTHNPISIKQFQLCDCDCDGAWDVNSNVSISNDIPYERAHTDGVSTEYQPTILF